MYLSLYPQISRFLTPDKENFPLQQMDTTKRKKKLQPVQLQPCGANHQQIHLQAFILKFKGL